MLERFWSKYAIYILAAILLWDIGYSFAQFNNTVLDGDMAGVIIPSDIYKPVMKDPLGLQVLLDHKFYASPNRFSSHWCMYHYFRTVPFLMQSFASPIDSIYLSCAILKTFTQVLIITLLALYITVSHFTWRNFLLAAVLITPLFQTFGYNHTMGIIDIAPTYVFFYALPLGFLLLLFYPFYKSLCTQQPLSLLSIILLVLWALFLAFDGSITPGIMLLISVMMMAGLWYHYFQLEQNSLLVRSYRALNRIPRYVLYSLLLFIAFACYSFYIGLYNLEDSDLVSLGERYILIPKGLWILLTENIGWPLLLLFIVLNVFVIQLVAPENKKQVINVLKVIVLFAVLYLLLLPLGGYRPYRPWVVRYDTFIPVTLTLFFFFGLSAYALLNTNFSRKKIYIAALCSVLLIFLLTERWKHSQNNHEREAMQTIAASKDSIVQIKPHGRLLTWDPVVDYHESENGAQVLQFWGVTKEKKYYYQK